MQKLLLLVPLNFLLFILDAYDYYFLVFFKTHIIIRKNRDSTPTPSLVKEGRKEGSTCALDFAGF